MVEAFVAILLMAGVVLIVLDRGESSRMESERIEDVERSILQGVQLNETLRGEILSTNGKILWESFSGFVPKTKARIESGIPGNFECNAQICEPSDSCSLANPVRQDIFSNSVLISTNIDTQGDFDPRVLKIFCWEK